VAALNTSGGKRAVELHAGPGILVQVALHDTGDVTDVQDL
jgi:hypothetical protein